jgi:hypothetical protein
VSLVDGRYRFRGSGVGSLRFAQGLGGLVSVSAIWFLVYVVLGSVFSCFAALLMFLVGADVLRVLHA